MRLVMNRSQAAAQLLKIGLCGRLGGKVFQQEQGARTQLSATRDRGGSKGPRPGNSRKAPGLGQAPVIRIRAVVPLEKKGPRISVDPEGPPNVSARHGKDAPCR